MANNIVLAYYLPQYHPTPHNDLWWGKGFTEWTNVVKAPRLFKNHYQPHVPADLGFYDLRLSEVREQQAEMAKYAGISAFCYYHYWFEFGNEELALPFKEVLRLKRPEFPFCLCWANESWYSKMWNNDGAVVSKRLLAEQKVPEPKDNIKHFESLLPAFRDNRYFRYNGKLVFVIYRPLLFEKEIPAFINQWRELAHKNSLGDFYFIGYSYNITNEYEKIIALGFDAVNSCGIYNYKENLNKNKILSRLAGYKRAILKRPMVYQYKDVSACFINKNFDTKENVIPTLIPNWDHTPRSGLNGFLFDNSSPLLFKNHLANMNDLLSHKDNKICFLKSWNEWGEGNYVEPDLRWGWGYLNALRQFNIDVY